MTELLIFTLIASLIGTTLVFNHFINKSVKILEDQHKEYIASSRAWSLWAAPFIELSKDDMKDIHDLIMTITKTNDPEEKESCIKALKEIMANEPITVHSLGESNAD